VPIVKNNTGLLLIDKPSGWTSHDVVAKVRHITGIKTVGHAGTLDPLATGLLIVLVGKEFTKQQTQFLKMDKEYVVTAQLGITTDSYDTDGQIVSQAEWSQVKKINQAQVKTVLTHLTGAITQTVPAFSAVKVKGKKLYNLARKQQLDLATLPQRQVKIYSLELLNFTIDQVKQQILVTLKIKCSSGTYIRSLVHDLGQLLGVGATVTRLRRTHIGPYRVEDAEPLNPCYTDT